MSPELEEALRRGERQWAEDQLRRRLLERERRWRKLLASTGSRFEDCRLDNFQAAEEPKREVLRRLRGYAGRLPEHVLSGRGVLLYGSCGTGKDHLLIGLARIAVFDHDLHVRRTTGAELWRSVRDTFGSRSIEADILRPLAATEVLILSDPIGPFGSLSPWQASVLLDLVDCRWRNQRPIWCSLNVADASEADERLGAAVVDRLQDGALVLGCRWPSWRRKGKLEIGN